jgi:predicted esterase
MRALEAVCRHVTASPAAAAAGASPPAAAQVLRSQARTVLRYLRAFDSWQRLSNPRDPSSVEPARQRIANAARLGGDTDDVFSQYVAELAEDPALLSDASVEAWLQVLLSLSAVHRKNILAEPNVEGGKARSMSHGVKYPLYELRNAAGLEPLRPYWVATGEYGDEDQRDEAGIPDEEWAALEEQQQEGGAAAGQPRLPVGVLHIDEEHEDAKNATLEPQGLPKLLALTSSWSLYVPESYSSSSSYPLVLAMHGGGGRGDDYLLSWLTTARTHGAFVIAPNSMDRTWGLMSDAEARQDAISVLLMMFQVCQNYSAIDTKRILCTGMSDGGTFSYILNQVLPRPVFQGMACAAAFPVPATMAAEDLQLHYDGFPTHHVHGTTDWMFSILQVREADSMATAALGSSWTMTELKDWTHASPSAVNQSVIWPWFASLSPSDSPELVAARGEERPAFDGNFLELLHTMAPEMFEKQP